MIIKSISVKSNSHRVIRGVLDYVSTDGGLIKDQRHAVYHNVVTSELDGLASEFKRNFDEYSHVQNKTPVRHVILAPSPASKHLITHEIMDDLMKEHLRYSYPMAMAYGMQHTEDKWHGHLVISGNDLFSKTSTRQSKQDLYRAHVHMLEYMQEKYPQLEIGIDLKNYGRKLHSEKAYYKEKRNPELNMTRDELSKTVMGLFKLSENTQDFENRLKNMGLKTYNYKGHLQGVHFGNENKKMRFSRLGIPKELFQELNVQDDRLKELEQLREDSDERSMNDREFDR